LAYFDTRKIVQISLKTDSGKEAAIEAVDVDKVLMAYRDALRRNDCDPERYKALVKIAASRNLSCCPLQVRLQRPLDHSFDGDDVFSFSAFVMKC
jgi:hypothetical protein